ncbi:hypothetical protein ACFE04_015964 [Oxalis oulophora]
MSVSLSCGAVSCASVHVGQIRPGTMRGNHRHHNCNETFVIWGAKTLFRLENKEATDKGYAEVIVGENEVALFASPSGTAHALSDVIPRVSSAKIYRLNNIWLTISDLQRLITGGRRRPEASQWVTDRVWLEMSVFLALYKDQFSVGPSIYDKILQGLSLLCSRRRMVSPTLHIDIDIHVDMFSERGAWIRTH